jgi:aspartate/methionine/tyrosine aminotransferase
VKGLQANRINGAFYIMNIFDKATLKKNQHLPITNKKVRELIEQLTHKKSLPMDKRFSYYLLASTGICVVPATDFEAEFMGFRVTALEHSKNRLINTYNKLAGAIEKYLAS